MSGLFDAQAYGLNQLRADFREVAEWNESRGIWSASDKREFNADIKRVFDSGNQEGIAYWCLAIHEEVEFIRCMKAAAATSMRALEASIKAAKKVAA